MVCASSLNQRVTIEHLVSGQDAIGQPVQTWTTLATVWADVRHLSGLETIKADAETSVVKASIRIRYRADVNATMRATLDGRVYAIKAVLPGGRKAWLDLACEVING